MTEDGRELSPTTPDPLEHWARACAPLAQAMLRPSQPGVLLSALFCMRLADRLANDLGVR